MTNSSTSVGNRGAIASVRGYLYQFAKVIERLLLATDGEAAVCVETFDDIAIETADGGHELVQVRHRATPFSLFSQPGLRLLESWLELDQPPHPTFAFVSTQQLSPSHFALLGSDSDNVRVELDNRINALGNEGFPHLRKTLPDRKRFKYFWDRITWLIGQDNSAKDGEDALTIAIENLEKTARGKFGDGAETRILPWLAAVALSASDLREDRRRWTQARLLEVDSKTNEALVEALYDLREAELGFKATAQATSGREIDALVTAMALGSPRGFPSSAAFRGVATAVLAAYRSFPLRHPNESCVSDAVFSLDGSRVITACYDKVVRVWDAYSHRLLAELPGHKAFLYKLALSPDGETVAVTCDDGSVTLWDICTENALKTLDPVVPSRGRPRDLAFSSAGDTLLTVSAGAALLWDVAAGHVRGKVEDGVMAACLSSTGWLATLHAHGVLRISDALTLSILAEVAQPAENIAGVVASADGHSLLSWNRHDAWLRDQNGSARAHITLPGVVRQGVFSPDGTCFLLTGRDGTARLFDTNFGGLVSPLHGHIGPVDGGSFSRDGSLVVATHNNNRCDAQ